MPNEFNRNMRRIVDYTIKLNENVKDSHSEDENENPYYKGFDGKHESSEEK